MRSALLAPWLLFACAAPASVEPERPEAWLDGFFALRLPAPTARLAPGDARPDAPERAWNHPASPAAEPHHRGRLTFELPADGQLERGPILLHLVAGGPGEVRLASTAPELGRIAEAELEELAAEVDSAAVDADGEPAAADADLLLLDGHLTGGYLVGRDRNRFRASLVGGLRYVLIDPEDEAGAEVGGQLELVGPFVGLRFQF